MGLVKPLTGTRNATAADIARLTVITLLVFSGSASDVSTSASTVPALALSLEGGYLDAYQVSALSHSLNVPVSAKLRLCQNIPSTHDLGARLEAAGASWLTLHARHVSARRRRQGAADLSQIKELKSRVGVPVVSNGNVKTWEDVVANRAQTGADGVMVGETLLANPCLFANIIPDPVRISLEYLDICREHPDTATMQMIQTHVRHIVDHQYGRRPWYNKFRATLGQCETIDDIERILRVKVQRWRGLPPLTEEDDDDDAADEDEGSEDATQQDQDG